jgi:glycosyltransferase involved in cell wall biosynthesis
MEIEVFFNPKKIKKDIDLIYTGRFVTLKHVPFIVEIVNELKKKKPDIKAYLVGGSKADNEYKMVADLINKYNLEKNVIIVGPQEHKKMAEYYNRSKMLIFIAFSQGVGKTIIEAMACELPFVTNMYPAEGEYSFTDKEGFASVPIEVNAFANKISILLNDENMRKSKGKAAREKVLLGYTPEITSKRTFELYRSLLKKI